MLGRGHNFLIDTRIPLTSGRYSFVDNFTLIFVESQKIVPLTVNEKGEKIAYIDFGSFGLHLKLSVLIAMVYKCVRIPVPLWNMLDVMYLDGDVTNVRPTNLIWSFPNTGLKTNIDSDFRIVPGFSRYQVNSKGEVFSLAVYRKLSPYVDREGYLMYGLTPDVGKRTIIGMHRLLALAFLTYPPNVDELDVNHKNGIKNDNNISNLEWASRKRNCDHAYSTGLRTDNVETLVKNIFTGEIKEFYSIEECARILFLDGETVRLRLNSEGQKTYFPGFQFKKKSSNTNWAEVDDPMLEIRKTGLSLPLNIRNLITNETTQVIGQKAAGKLIGISHSAVGFHMKNNVSKKVVRDFEISYPDFRELSLSSFTEM